MEKRVILAFVLSMMVLLIWSALFRQQGLQQQPIVNQTVTTVTLPGQPAEKNVFAEARLEEIRLDNYKVSLAPDYAGIKEIVLNKYQDYHLILQGAYLADLTSPFTTEKIGRESRFVYQDADKRIIQSYNFSNSNYTIELSIIVQNLKSEDLHLSLPLVLSRIKRAEGADSKFQTQDVVFNLTDKTLYLSPWKETVSGEGLKFVGLRERYFCAILQPQEGKLRGFIKKINSRESLTGLWLDTQLPANKDVTFKFLLYAGPLDLELLKQVNPQWQNMVYYGFFDPISKFLLNILRFFYKFTHNWGWAIVLLSIFIYAILFPLSLRQMHSMKEMQLLQPKIEELRKIYKNNPQKLNKEIMLLYKEHKVNPFGGCLPLILQLPIFFALYQALMRSLELKGANFLWIKDLSQPDRLFRLPWQMPLLGNEFNLLPILMSIGMFLQQKLTAKSATTSTEQQKMMLVLFPIMFGVLFYHMPSGLVLYWFINSTLMLVYQFKLR